MIITMADLFCPYDTENLQIKKEDVNKIKFYPYFCPKCKRKFSIDKVLSEPNSTHHWGTIGKFEQYYEQKEAP